MFPLHGFENWEMRRFFICCGTSVGDGDDYEEEEEEKQKQKHKGLKKEKENFRRERRSGDGFKENGSTHVPSNHGARVIGGLLSYPSLFFVCSYEI